jgi:hypothetical protein
VLVVLFTFGRGVLLVEEVVKEEIMEAVEVLLVLPLL